MRELTQVCKAVVEALKSAGVTALEAFPDSAKRYEGAVAAVTVGAAEGKTLGFCTYLGEVQDSATGAVRELYGKQLEGNITVDIRAEALLGSLPAGIRPGELRWEALTWERATGMFLRRGNLRCQAVFTAESREDGEGFLDFILKGVMKRE